MIELLANMINIEECLSLSVLVLFTQAISLDHSKPNRTLIGSEHTPPLVLGSYHIDENQ